jgi:hypothetical protein
MGRPSDRVTEPADTPFVGASRPAPALHAVPDLPDEDPVSDGLSLSGPRLPMAPLHVTPAVPPRTARPAVDLPIRGDAPSDVGLPSEAAEDLPSWGDDRPPTPLDQLVAFVRRDTFAAIGLCVMVVLALTLLLRAC